MPNWWMVAIPTLSTLILVLVCYQARRQLKQQQQKYNSLKSRYEKTLDSQANMRNRHKRLLGASTQALIVVEDDYRVSQANKVAKKLFGKVKKGTSLMGWTRQHQLQELVRQVLQGEKVIPIYIKRGEKALMVSARSVRHKPDKDIVAVALALQDVTRLRQLTRARRDFVANISHELRTPITSIRLLTETLLNGALRKPDMGHELVTQIAIQADALSQIAQEVLDLSLIESGKAPLRFANYPLAPIIHSQVELLQPQAERKHLKIVADLPEEIQVLVDEVMIKRVIANLVQNAIKFTTNGQITLCVHGLADVSLPTYVKLDDEWLVISVTDTGVGLSDDELRRIFERFYIVDRARNRKEAGTGLGLAIAKHIIEGHGGYIWAESDGRTGSTFYFTIPREA